MKIIRIQILVLFLLLLHTACSSDSEQRLDYALKFAGENRAELEKVLTHYAEEPEKLAAARFLIENMPYLYGYRSGQLDSIKQVLSDAIQRKSISLLDSLYQGRDVIKAGSTISRILKEEEFYTNHNFTLPHFGGEYLFHNRVGTGGYRIIYLPFMGWCHQLVGMRKDIQKLINNNITNNTLQFE